MQTPHEPVTPAVRRLTQRWFADGDGMRATTVALIALALTGTAGSVSVAQQQKCCPLTILQRADVSVAGREAVVATHEGLPGTATGWHTHPGEMVGYITEGVAVIEQRAQEAMTITAGQSFIIAAGTPHNIINSGRTLARMVVTYLVDKDKALSAPADAPN